MTNPNNILGNNFLEEKMESPPILGRMEDDDLIDSRSSTQAINTVEVPFAAGAIGKVVVTVFKSQDDEDRGGLVFRITLDDQGSSFIPHAVSLENGIELHMAGDIEAQSLVQALKTVLSSL
jgi:hypothetical protein